MDPSKRGKLLCSNLCNEKGLKVCTRCKAAWYCSKECQIRHWRTHKKCCKIISSSLEMRLRFEKALKTYTTAIKQMESGEFDQALLSFQNSLKIFQEFQHDELISACYYSIGRVLQNKRQYEEALVNYRKALEITREIHGDNHSSTCDCYESIGTVLGAQGRYDDALIGYGKAFAIRMKTFGENHIDTGQSHSNIGLNQLQKGDYDGALLSLQKAKKIFTCVLGAQHPQTVDTNNQIDFCQRKLAYVPVSK